MKTRPLIIAHRGESFDAPENTLASINLAWARNDDAVEVDIHLTKDKRIVVFHDFNTNRIVNKKIEIKDANLEELRVINIGNEKYPNEKIPTLDEILATVPTNGKLVIEIKSNDEIIPSLIEVIKNSKLTSDQIEFIGFNYQTIVETKKSFHKNNVHWLLKWNHYLLSRLSKASIAKIISKLKAGNLDGAGLQSSKLINQKLINNFNSAGLLVSVWTVDSPQRAKEYLNMGINAITSNRAEWLRKQLQL